MNANKLINKMIMNKIKIKGNISMTRKSDIGGILKRLLKAHNKSRKMEVDERKKLNEYYLLKRSSLCYAITTIFRIENWTVQCLNNLEKEIDILELMCEILKGDSFLGNIERKEQKNDNYNIIGRDEGKENVMAVNIEIYYVIRFLFEVRGEEIIRKCYAGDKKYNLINCVLGAETEKDKLTLDICNDYVRRKEIKENEMMKSVVGFSFVRFGPEEEIEENATIFGIIEKCFKGLSGFLMDKNVCIGWIGTLGSIGWKIRKKTEEWERERENNSKNMLDYIKRRGGRGRNRRIDELIKTMEEEGSEDILLSLFYHCHNGYENFCSFSYSFRETSEQLIHLIQTRKWMGW